MDGKARQGRTGASARLSEDSQSSAGAGEAQRSRMPRRGCHRKVTGGGQTGFLQEILNVSMTGSGH